MPDFLECPIEDSEWLGVWLNFAVSGGSDFSEEFVECADVGVVAGVVGSSQEFSEIAFFVAIVCWSVLDQVGVMSAGWVADGEDCLSCGDVVGLEHRLVLLLGLVGDAFVWQVAVSFEFSLWPRMSITGSVARLLSMLSLLFFRWSFVMLQAVIA